MHEIGPNSREISFYSCTSIHFVFTFQESSVAEVENEISRDILDIANTTTRVRQLQDIMDNLNDEIHQKNATISKIEGEIVKRNAIIERKQSTIDQYNKRIDQMRSKDGVRGKNSTYFINSQCAATEGQKAHENNIDDRRVGVGGGGGWVLNICY